MGADEGGGNWIGLNVYLLDDSSLVALLGCFWSTEGQTNLPESADVDESDLALLELMVGGLALHLSSSAFVCILVIPLLVDDDDDDDDGAVMIRDETEFDGFGDGGMAANGENGDDAWDLTIDRELPV